MNSTELKRELVGRLCDGARAFLDRALPEVGESPIYAFAFFCASGCTSVGGALATSAGLQKRNQDIGSGEDRQRIINTVHPTEWDSVNRHFELFADANAYLDEIFRILEEETLDDVDLDALEGEAEWDFTYGFFIDAFAEALTALRSEGRFAAPRFEADVLLGALFSDPGKYDLRVVEGVSRKVNSPPWHMQVERYCALAKV